MRKTLQILLGLFGTVVILISLLHLVFGPSAIPGAVPVNATMDSEDRFYAMLFLAFGTTLIWCIKNVETKAAVVYFLMLTFLVGGIARLISIAAVGRPNDFFTVMLALELSLPFIFAYLQYRVSAAKSIQLNIRSIFAFFSSIAFGVATLTFGQGVSADLPRQEENGTIHVQTFDLPESSYLSEETRAALARQHVVWAAASRSSCAPLEGAARETVAEIRKCQAAEFYQTSVYKDVRDRYPVVIAPQQIGGVYTEVFAPLGGVAPRNRERVLINLHGGGFLEGSRSISHIESIPIAAVARIKVISVDYRQAPEYRFPAASQDVTAVYRRLLKTYKPRNIGIFGCSAGGLLTAETMAWLRKEHLPLPGAVGMFCMGASYTGKGDSAYIARAIEGSSAAELAKYFAYFEGTNPKDPLVYPVQSNSVMAAFPPSLLITGTRDHALSSVVYTHSRLAQLGVKTDLYVFEGMGHAFFYNPDLSESREVYVLVGQFFDAHLGT